MLRAPELLHILAISLSQEGKYFHTLKKVTPTWLFHESLYNILNSHFPHPHTCILLQYPQKILKACLLGQGSGSPFPPKVTSSGYFSPLKKYQNLPSDLRFKYLWFPVAVMLHACPAFDKLTERRMRPSLASATKELENS